MYILVSVHIIAYDELKKLRKVLGRIGRDLSDVHNNKDEGSRA